MANLLPHKRPSTAQVGVCRILLEGAAPEMISPVMRCRVEAPPPTATVCQCVLTSNRQVSTLRCAVEPAPAPPVAAGVEVDRGQAASSPGAKLGRRAHPNSSSPSSPSIHDTTVVHRQIRHARRKARRSSYFADRRMMIMRRGLGTTRCSRVASDATTWRALGLALGSCWERGARGGAVANRTNALLTHRVCWTISEHINSSKQCGSTAA